jgi:glycine oxidase
MGSSASLWWDLLSTDEVDALHRVDELPRAADVVVVGGGMLGTLTAWFCRRSGLGRVVLLEADHLGAGASGGAAGLLVPEAHFGTEPQHFVDLGRLGLGLWRQLGEEVAGGFGMVDIDWLGLEPRPPGWRAPSTASRLAADEVAELVPGIAAVAPGVLVPNQGWVNPLRALAAVASELPTVVTGAAVTGLAGNGDRGVGLATALGRISAGLVVFATGGPPRIEGMEVELPSSTIRGHIITTQPTNQRMPGSIEPVATRLPDGRLLVGGTEDVDDLDEIDPDTVTLLRGWLDGILPGNVEIATGHVWCCFRPAHPDHLPVIDRVPGLENAWFTSGHYRTGILMAPATANALVIWITSSSQPEEVVRFAMSRFERPLAADR